MGSLQYYFDTQLRESRRWARPLGRVTTTGPLVPGSGLDQLCRKIDAAAVECAEAPPTVDMVLFEQEMRSIAREFGLWYTLPGGEGPYNEEEL